MVQSCRGVGEAFLRGPAAAVRQHTDRTFYTECPVDVWRLWNQHLDLANDTACPFLQALIVSKMRDTLLAHIDTLHSFVCSLEGAGEGRLELLCALLNDSAFHIEHMCACIQSFEDELRGTVDDLFRDVITALVRFGQRCVSGLVELVMADTESLLARLTSAAWWEQQLLQTVIATVRDYCADFELFLVPFWLTKLAVHLLETLVLRYAQTLLFKGYQIERTRTARLKQRAVYLLRFVSPTKDTWTVDGEAVAGLARDVSSLSTFLGQRSALPPTHTRSILQLMDDVLCWLQAEAHELAQLVRARMQQSPAAAQAVFETGAACIRLRKELPAAMLQTYTSTLQPLIAKVRYRCVIF
jgi:hypothetical protein